MMMMAVLVLGFLGLCPYVFNDFDVVVEDCGNHGDHISLHHPSPNSFCAPNAYVDDTLESQIPLPHVHHVFAATLLQDADQPFDAAIDGQDVADASRRCCEVSEMVERVDQGQGRRAIEGASVVKGGGNAHRRLVDIGYAEVDFPHLGSPPRNTR